MYLTIDKFSEYATFHKLMDSNWVAVLAALKQRIHFLGKMRKLVFDNERCRLHSAVRLFLEAENITTHVINL